MSTARENAPLPEPPVGLKHGEVTLQPAGGKPGDPSRGLVPYYHIRILNGASVDAGHISLSVGDTDQVGLYVGHIRFGVLPAHRGLGYAGQACRTVDSWVRHFYETVAVTCDSDNEVSRRTLERLDTRLVEETAVPTHESRHIEGTHGKATLLLVAASVYFREQPGYRYRSTEPRPCEAPYAKCYEVTHSSR